MPTERIFITYQPINYRPSSSDPIWQPGPLTGTNPTGIVVPRLAVFHMQINYQDSSGNITVLEAHPSDHATVFGNERTTINGQAYIRPWSFVGDSGQLSLARQTLASAPDLSVEWNNMLDRAALIGSNTYTYSAFGQNSNSFVNDVISSAGFPRTTGIVDGGSYGVPFVLVPGAGTNLTNSVIPNESPTWTNPWQLQSDDGGTIDGFTQRDANGNVRTIAFGPDGNTVAAEEVARPDGSRTVHATGEEIVSLFGPITELNGITLDFDTTGRLSSFDTQRNDGTSLLSRFGYTAEGVQYLDEQTATLPTPAESGWTTSVVATDYTVDANGVSTDWETTVSVTPRPWLEASVFTGNAIGGIFGSAIGQAIGGGDVFARVGAQAGLSTVLSALGHAMHIYFNDTHLSNVPDAPAATFEESVAVSLNGVGSALGNNLIGAGANDNARPGAATEQRIAA